MSQTKMDLEDLAAELMDEMERTGLDWRAIRDRIEHATFCAMIVTHGSMTKAAFRLGISKQTMIQRVREWRGRGWTVPAREYVKATEKAEANA